MEITLGPMFPLEDSEFEDYREAFQNYINSDDDSDDED